MSNDPLVGLRWALKRSFLDYIARAPGGRASLRDGAVATELKEIVFGPELRARPASAQEAVFHAFRGTVTFTAHFGMLFVRISNPWVTIQEGQGELTIVDPIEKGGDARLRLATFIVDGHGIADGFEYWMAADVRLAPEASALFNDVYPGDSPLEPLAIVVPVAGPHENSASE
jgi:hypothetical protein